ncbi:MAG TPA: sugar ABC transporter ATP-binding protein [Devosiaceae bacterium]|jgi:ABC-type sugar transport system ATPase subunit|nr:sugar ABC transporter ATP-binding protein [Devosiaceae bacterium]
MPELTVRHIKKSFDGNPAIRDISFSVAAGRVLALVGENGAGKSTLMRVLSGAIQPDGGEVLLDGEPARIARPADALSLGIRIVYQELSLLPHLSVGENVLLGRMPTRGLPFQVDWREVNRIAGATLAGFGFPDIDPQALVRSLSVPRQQVVEIAKALVTEPRILILDEPTAVLSASETDRLFAKVRELARSGATVIYISHRLEEIFEIADEVVVLKDGQSVLQGEVGTLTQAELITAMVGRPLEAIYPERNRTPGHAVLEIEQLCDGHTFEGIDLTVHAGEIVGMFGLVGSGRTELAKAVFGSEAWTSGEVRLEGAAARITNPAAAVRAGMAMITEDRKGDGLALDASVADNAMLASYRRTSRAGVIDGTARKRMVDQKVRELSIRLRNTAQPVRQLSGGNQQKVVLAKWMLVEGTKLFIFDEPTRGVDIATKVEIYQMIADLAAAGAAVLLISSEMPEVLGLSDRLLVMREGRLVAELEPSGFNPEVVFAHAAGLTLHQGSERLQ